MEGTSEMRLRLRFRKGGVTQSDTQIMVVKEYRFAEMWVAFQVAAKYRLQSDVLFPSCVEAGLYRPSSQTPLVDLFSANCALNTANLDL